MKQTILAISGKPGLYKLVSRATNSLIVEALDETHKQLSHTYMIIYLLGLGCTWFIIYVVFSQGIKIYISYPLFIIYLAFAWRQYRRHHIAKYMCGRCGRPIRVLGRCPHCGAINK